MGPDSGSGEGMTDVPISSLPFLLFTLSLLSPLPFLLFTLLSVCTIVIVFQLPLRLLLVWFLLSPLLLLIQPLRYLLTPTPFVTVSICFRMTTLLQRAPVF